MDAQQRVPAPTQPSLGAEHAEGVLLGSTAPKPRPRDQEKLLHPDTALSISGQHFMLPNSAVAVTLIFFALCFQKPCCYPHKWAQKAAAVHAASPRAQGNPAPPQPWKTKSTFWIFPQVQSSRGCRTYPKARGKDSSRWVVARKQAMLKAKARTPRGRALPQRGFLCLATPENFTRALAVNFGR